MNTLERIQMLIEKGEKVRNTHTPNPPNFIGFTTLDNSLFSSWKNQSAQFLQANLPPDSPYIESFQKIVKSEGHMSNLDKGLGILVAVREDIEGGMFADLSQDVSPIQVLDLVCERFHLVARQLRSRYDNRETLDVQDEYDVQDLLCSLLQMYFDDVRSEEYCPSYAGKSSRTDFLLKQERIMVEVKKSRRGLSAKELGSQLLEDIARYSAHPDCDVLYCFVYDPDGRIANPRGIESDLQKLEGSPTVKVLIRP